MHLVGTFISDITPKESVDLNGYILRFGKSQGVHDPLTANFCYIESNNNKTLLISLDILTISFELFDKISNQISVQFGIDRKSIIIAAIHTHAAVGAPYLRNVGEENLAWVKDFEEKIIEGCKEAIKNKVNCNLYVYEAFSSIGINRRNSYRGIDPNTPFIVARNETGIVAMLINYNCHPVCLTESNLYISADYIYFLRKHLCEKLEQNFPVLFFNGGSGDIDPKHRGSFNEAKITGENLAEEILLNYKAYQGKILGNNISHKTITMNIPYDWHPTVEEAKLNYLKYSQELTNAKTKEEKKIAGAFYQWASEVLEKTKTNELPKSLTITITLITIDNVNFIAVPLEIFSSISLKLRKLFGNNTFVISYSNGYSGYLSDKASHIEGGYEIDDWHKYAGILPKVPYTEDIFWECINEIKKNEVTKCQNLQ